MGYPLPTERLVAARYEHVNMVFHQVPYKDFALLRTIPCCYSSACDPIKIVKIIRMWTHFE